MPFVECKKHHSIVCQICRPYPLELPADKLIKKKKKTIGYLEDKHTKGKGYDNK